MSKLTPIILIVFAGIIFFGLVNPQYQQVKALREESARYDEVLTKVRDLLDKRAKLQEKYSALPQSDIQRIQALLPNNIDNVKLVLDIDRIAGQYGIAVKNISVNENKAGEIDRKAVSTDSGAYGVATITFGVSAPYETFLKFIRDLEDGLRLIDVTAITLDPKDPKAYNYSVTFKTYWLK